jgi:uncharacterized protein (TIGR00299 family) protein
MKNLLYIDCSNSGIAGDMFLAALHGLKEDTTILNRIQTYVNENFLHVRLSIAKVENISRNGLFPNKLHLEYSEKYPELHVNEIESHIPSLCDNLNLNVIAKNFASRWFSIILHAEQSVHTSSETNDLHLHELGSIDTLIDICGCTAYLYKLGVFSTENFKIMCSTVAVGGGLVRISHGTVPVPAPATLKIIEKYSIPIHGGPVEKELFTPTGAALLGTLIEMKGLQFSEFIPLIQVIKTGFSTGTLGNETFPNILRVFSGTSSNDSMESGEDVIVLETMVDDISGETLGIVMEYLFEAGALDVNYISVQGKKNRPGILIRILSSKSHIDALMSVLFSQLGTLGVRYRVEKRICLKRDIIEMKTEIDNVSVRYKVKVAFNPTKPEEIIFFKLEHDDLVRISKQLGKPLSIIRTKLESNWLANRYGF